MNVAPDNITSLAPNEIFVFGSNIAGRHGKGAALQAMQWGAIRGKGLGPMGQCYAIPTKDSYMRVLPIWMIAQHVDFFFTYAKRNPDKKFLVTAIGTGLAKFPHEEMARLFFSHEIPDNVYLPKVFWDQKT